MASRRDAKNLLKTYNEYRRQINEKLAEIERVSPDSMILERYRKDFEEITTDTPNYNTLQKMDTSLVEAAQDVGANRWVCFWKVIVPRSMPGV